MNRISVALIYGGQSEEHEISLRSAASIYKNIDKNKFYIHLIGIDKQGGWFLQDPPKNDDNDQLKIESELKNIISIIPSKGFSTNRGPIAIDVVIPVIHGTTGEDGTIQGLLEITDIPYVGARGGASFLGMEKEVAKILWKEAGLPIVPFISLTKDQWALKKNALKDLFLQIKKELSFPIFVKPVQSGSSVGVSQVKNEKDLKAAIEEAFLYDTKVLLEKSIDAREIECSVIGNHQVRSFTPGELNPTHDFYDYDAKYLDPNGAGFHIPALLEKEELDLIQDLAKKAYKALGCTGLSRVDFFKDHQTGEIFINEINTFPGFTSTSMFPQMCQEGGLTFQDLIEILIDYAFEAYKGKIT